MSKTVEVREAHNGDEMRLEVKAFLRGALRGESPVVAIVLSSTEGDIAAVVEMPPETAHILGEYIRQEAELATVVKEDNYT